MQPEINKRARVQYGEHVYESVKDTVPEWKMAFVCPKCHFPNGQKGFVRKDRNPGDPDFGIAFPCPRCNGRAPF